MWSLVPAQLSGDEKNWLILRKRDEEASARRRSARATRRCSRRSRRTVPSGEDWSYEVKWDGYRAIAYVRGGDVALVSRTATT